MGSSQANCGRRDASDCLLRHIDHSVINKMDPVGVCRWDFIKTDSKWYRSSPNTSHLPFYRVEKSSQIQSWCETPLMLAALQPLTCSSGFGPGLQSAKLSLDNGSSSTINSCLSSSHTLWANSPLSIEAFLISSIPLLLLVQVTADWCWLPVMHCSAFTKSLNLFSFAERKCQLPEAPTWILLMTGITYCLSLFCLYLMVYWKRAQFMYAPRYCFIGIPWVDALLLPS